MVAVVHPHRDGGLHKTQTDAIMLFESIGNAGHAAQLEAADCNQDGSIDFTDLYTLMQQMQIPTRNISLSELYHELHSPEY